MKLRHLLSIAAVSAILAACGGDDPKEPDKEQGGNTNTEQTDDGKVKLPDGKKIYIPEEFRKMDFQSKNSQWSYHRMAYTDNFVIFWEKGFGDDLSKAPKLDGQNMTVDLENLKTKLESFYKVYHDELGFVKGESTCEKYRMMVMLEYSLEGTAYGGSYDNMIGALWIAPNRVQDKQLNAIAHELGHCFQFQIWADGRGDAWGGHLIFEMTSQWMLWQVNPNWMTDESYHWDVFKKKTHKAFLHPDNMYTSPYVLEYWSQTRGLDVMGRLFAAGKTSEDPVETYKKLFSLNQSDFCDEMYDACCHIVNLDFDRVWNETRKFANTCAVKLGSVDDRLRPSASVCPESYGFNAINLTIPEPGNEVSADFVGQAGLTGYSSSMKKYAGWRYGFMGVDKNGKSVYGRMYSEDGATATFTIPEGGLDRLYFVVMGAPTTHFHNPDNGNPTQWPYDVKFKGTAQK